MSEDRLKHWKEAKSLTLAEAALLIINLSPDDWKTEKLLKSQPDGFNAVFKDLLNDANTYNDDRYELNDQGEYYSVFELHIDNRVNGLPISWEDGIKTIITRHELDKWLKNNKRPPLFSSKLDTDTTLSVTKAIKSKSARKDESALEDFDKRPDTSYVEMPMVMALFSIGKSTVYRAMADGRIPKSYKPTPHTARWLVGELREVLKKVT